MLYDSAGVIIMEKAMKILGVCIVIASIIMSATILIKENRENDIHSGLPDRYKIVGSRVFDTVDGKYVEPIPDKQDVSKVTITNAVLKKSERKPFIASDFDNSKYFEERKALLESADKISFTVQNNDTITHDVIILVTYYDKKDKALLTDTTHNVKLLAGEIAELEVLPKLQSDAYAKYDAEVRPNQN